MNLHFVGSIVEEEQGVGVTEQHAELHKSLETKDSFHVCHQCICTI